MEEQKKYISFLKQKNVGTPNKVFKNLSSVGIGKMDRLMNGDIWSEKTTFQAEYRIFTDKVPGWTYTMGDCNNNKKRIKKGDNSAGNNEVENLFWTQFNVEQNKRVLVIRKQNSGLCYLHAPVVLEHYLIAISTDCENASMIDIGFYEANLLEGDQLKDFLLKDEGGGSVVTLRNICGLRLEDIDRKHIPHPTDPAFVVVCEGILEKVANTPALVSNFTVYEEFSIADKFSYDGVPNEHIGTTKLQRHAMVLIGARKTVEQKYYFLLQNWWENKYFVEVSAEYMYHCEGSINFVRKPITRSNNLQTNMASYAETSIDAPESSAERN